MNTHTTTAMNLFADPVDRDAQRIAHDVNALRGRRPALLARVARRSWAEIVRQWHVQELLHARASQLI
jgi:hypothetical protein